MNYPTDFIDNIICGDSLEIMKSIPDKSIDVILTDPPYGVGVEYDSFQDTQDNLLALIQPMMKEMLRVSKRCALTCGHTNIWKYPEATWIMAWVNSAGNNRNSWGFTCWQPILCYGKDPFLANGMGARQDIIVHNESAPDVKHPVPKPVEFWKRLLLRVSVKSTDIVLDPFMGSGTTAIVCKETGRHYIGIEISQSYCDIAKNRLIQSSFEPSLFGNQ